jgi:hypothetical protein
VVRSAGHAATIAFRAEAVRSRTGQCRGITTAQGARSSESAIRLGQPPTESSPGHHLF